MGLPVGAVVLEGPGPSMHGGSCVCLSTRERRGEGWKHRERAREGRRVGGREEKRESMHCPTGVYNVPTKKHM